MTDHKGITDAATTKQAEDALREGEASYRCLIENAPDAIFVQSDRRFVYLNPAAFRLFGVSRPEELRGKTDIERRAPEYHAAFLERIRLQRETGQPAPLMRQEYLRVDGSRVPVETTAEFIRYVGADAHLVLVRDITDRRRAEEALAGEKRFVEALFASLPGTAYVLDESGRLTRPLAPWLAEHPRFVFPHPPVHCSWMNQVEQWFGILQRKRLGLADFPDKTVLAERLLAYVAHWNEHAHPLNWSTKSAAKVMAKCQMAVAA